MLVFLERDQLWQGNLYPRGDRQIPDDLAGFLGLIPDWEPPTPPRFPSGVEAAIAPDPSDATRWYDTTDGLWWRWDGTYWKSEQILFDSLRGDRQQATAGFGLGTINQNYDLWLETFTVSGSCSTIGDVSNRWFFNLEYVNSSETITTLSQIFQNTAVNNRFNLVNSLGLHMDVSALGALAFVSRIFKTNAPADLNDFVVRVFYRLVKP